MKLKEIDRLFSSIDDIKHKEREGWKKREGIERPLDTVASHSFGTALIGWIIAEENEMDSGRMVKMLLLHDLIMAYLPDYTPQDDEFESKKQLEARKIEELIEDLPGAIREEAETLIKEMHNQETEFAKIAKEADKLETLMQARAYSDETSENIVEEFTEFYQEYFKSHEGERIFEKIREEAEESDTS